MKVLNAKGLEILNNIATKYRFQDIFEIEQHEVYNFCYDLLRCVQLGLRLDEDDKKFIMDVIDALTK
jgi:hypothetical protein